MKVVILAGGWEAGSVRNRFKPKPMIEIGEKQILWHIMKLYSVFGYNDFIICCGYKGYMIKDYSVHYYMYQTESTFDLGADRTQVEHSKAEPVTLVNTGLHTLTAGRLLRVKDYIGEDENFMLTYGDGVANVNIPALLDFH